MPRYIDCDEAVEYFERHKRIAIHKDDIISALSNMLTADVRENVHGRWICEKADSFRKFKVTCSKCGWYSYENYDSYCDPSEFDFCPGCGAKMDEGEEK